MSGEKLLRSAKSGDDWSRNELLAFNIEIKDATTAAFFNVATLPAPTVSQPILNNLTEPAGPLSKTDQNFFIYMRMAELGTSEESAVHDFAMFLLSMLDYDRDGRVLRSRKEMSFYMAGQRVDAKADVVLINRGLYLLLVQKDNRKASSDDPEPQLIPEAIAAFHTNNALRTRSGLQPLRSQTIPAIAMVGISPVFYRIMVTTALIDALVTSAYPVETTTVLRYVPPVPDPENYAAEGMRPLENRRVVFQCLTALKEIIINTR